LRRETIRKQPGGAMVENNSLLLGIDVGTSGTKSMIVDVSGNILGSGFNAYGHNSPQPGWVEQEPMWYVDGIRESAAMCAAAGVGIYKDVTSAGEAMAPKTTAFVPVEKTASFYNSFYREVYEGLYDSIENRLSRARRLALEFQGD
jgi:sugar (pentulose or hexulose) kinase